MCLGQKCLHHVDPAVMWLERDYEHMIEIRQPYVYDGLVSTYVRDDRTNALWTRGNTSAHVQPLLKLKDDNYLDGAWGEDYSEWSAIQGPLFPWEDEVRSNGGYTTVIEADQMRGDSYQMTLFTWYMDNDPKHASDHLMDSAYGTGGGGMRGMRADMVVLDEAVAWQASRSVGAMGALESMAANDREVVEMVPPSPTISALVREIQEHINAMNIGRWTGVVNRGRSAADQED